MMRIALICALALAVVAPAGTVEAHHSALAVAEEIGVNQGAQYAMFVPVSWTGRLVLYAHGFIDPEAPIALPDTAPPDVSPWVAELREKLLAAGYAVAYSSYSENGWAVKDGAERTHELRDLFRARFGAPNAVYVMGRSLGALVTLMLAETFPSEYRGALALCGPVGGGRLETDYVANVRVLFDFYFPGVIPGDVLNVPPMAYSADSPVVKAIVAAILAEPHKAAALASIDQIRLPYRTPSELVLSIVRPLGYNIRGTNDLLARTGGQSPFGNTTTSYTRLGLAERSVNAGVGLAYLEDYYLPSGDLRIPLLTLHTAMDPDVPIFHEPALAKIVAAAGKSRWLAQQSVQRYGHCNVTPAEVTLTLGRLVSWAQTGMKPASGDVTAVFALQSPESAISSTVSTLTSEAAFTEAILSSITGVSLP
jgi:pimeloyl-ACP methyl ester carboxylesterase